MNEQRRKVVVVGAGIGGLVAANRLARAGFAVTVIEKGDGPGGKMRELPAGTARIDAGPTVLTMRWVFDEIFAASGSALDAWVTLEPLEVLAHHSWTAGGVLNLYADFERSVDAIGSFAGASAAAGYRRFAAHAREIYGTLANTYMDRACDNPLALMRAVGWRRLPELWRIVPFTCLQSALHRYFSDPRLLQLFGRYATYCGSSPYLAPATLMLIAHVERLGVWSVKGGMHRLAEGLSGLAQSNGVTFRYGAEVRRIAVSRHRVSGVVLASEEHLDADAVVLNADAAALAAGLFGRGAQSSIRAMPARERSLSAVTLTCQADLGGAPLDRHNVFFSNDYAAEFEQLFAQQRLPDTPTLYVCAQDRGLATAPPAGGCERLLCLINAPATGDSPDAHFPEPEQCSDTIRRLLGQHGVTMTIRAMGRIQTTPREFAQLFPGTGGALYGRASHGWTASFRRPAARTTLTGLYLSGGSTHPGAGIPMAALSGNIAAQALIADHALTNRSARTAMPGGTSTPSATTDGTPSP